MRKEKIVTLDDRGNKLTFKIREMPATKLESWMIRAGMLLAGAGILESKSARSFDAGEAVTAAGKNIAENGLSALGQVDFEKAKPLLDELLACCVRIDAGIEQVLTPEVVDGIIEDVRTLVMLRKEALALNFSFFADAARSDTPDSARSHQPQGAPNRRISVRS